MPGQAGRKMLLGLGDWCMGLAACAVVASSPAAASTRPASRAASTERATLTPVTAGDEPVVETHHIMRTAGSDLAYTARAGRLAIRSEETGEVRGYVFFVAYTVDRSGPPRPITFAWNGGPLISAAVIHMEGLGPRRRTDAGMVDNAETLLATSDLVFMDPVETGFSRPARPEFATDFLNFEGDIGATVEFIRAYRTLFRARAQPLFIAGESYGVFRAAAVADRLTGLHEPLKGTILISGGIPNIPESAAFYDAWHVPGRTATAVHYGRLEPALLADPARTMDEARRWAFDIYRPALERVGSLDAAERERIAGQLSRYTGLRLDQIDRRTLVVPASRYLSDYLALDGSKVMTEEDTRLLEGQPGDDLGSPTLVDRYVRDELGYRTSLVYEGLEPGYVPTPGPRKKSMRDQWFYNQPGVTAAILREGLASGEVSPMARANPTWIPNALERDAGTRVFVATGRYDPLNMCEGDATEVASLPDGVRSRIETHCYDSGHIIYRDEKARPGFLRDVAAFIARAAGQEEASSARR